MKNVLFVLGLLAHGVIFSQDSKTAEKLMYYQRYQSAEHFLHQQLADEPMNARTWYLLTRAALLQGKTKSIVDSLNLASIELQNEPFFLVAKGGVLLQQGLKERAQPLFEQAIATVKQDKSDLLLAVAETNISCDSGDASQALGLINKSLKKDKHNPALYVAMGNAYRKLKNGTAAFEAYRKALDSDPSYAEALYMTGMIFVTQQNPEMYLEYFNKAIDADSLYAPAYYRLYFHFYYKNVHTAIGYLIKYIALSDPSLKTDYEYTDMLYLTGQHDKAIIKGNDLIKRGDAVSPRIFKLIAYSYKEKEMPDEAIAFMRKYFLMAPDSIKIAKDFVAMAELYLAKHENDSAAASYEKVISLESDTSNLLTCYKKLAIICKEQKKYAAEAYWYRFYCAATADFTNVDLFNWGIAHYLAGEYIQADSVFAKYAFKYPEQDFGYYWRARSNSAIDSAMEQGLAIPYYSKMIEIAQSDTSNATNRKHLVEAYGYLAAFEANNKKNYEVAIGYFEKLLLLDPDNESAKKYIDALKKNLAKKEASIGS